MELGLRLPRDKGTKKSINPNGVASDPEKPPDRTNTGSF